MTLSTFHIGHICVSLVIAIIYVTIMEIFLNWTIALSITFVICEKSLFNLFIAFRKILFYLGQASQAASFEILKKGHSSLCSQAIVTLPYNEIKM